MERALELADSGSCKNVTGIRRALRAEGFERVDQYFDGRAFKKQLTALIKSAREKSPHSSSEIVMTDQIERLADVMLLDVEFSPNDPVSHQV
jgi:hypothetical protein